MRHAEKMQVIARAIAGVLILANLDPAGAGAAPYCDLSADALALLGAYPDAQVHCEEGPSTTGGVKTFYGTKMTSGTSPDDAIQNWIQLHAGAVGMSPQELSSAPNPIRRTDVEFGKFTAYQYQHMYFGLPVNGNTVRFLVLNGSPSYVVYVSARFEDVIGGPPSLGPPELTAEDVIAALHNVPEYQDLSDWGLADIVLLREPDGPQHRVAWRIRGARIDADPRAFSFFVNAHTGVLLRTRSMVHDADLVSGVVEALASPGTLPDVAYNPPTATPIPAVHVSAGGIASGLTDAAGAFSFNFAGPWPTTLQADLGGGYIQIIPEQGCPVSESIPDVQPSDPPVYLLLNQGAADPCIAEPNEHSTSQVNALLHAARTKAFFQDRQPDFDLFLLQDIDTLNIYVNRLTPSCQGKFVSPDVLLFSAQGVPCVNMAYSTVVSHEFGHMVVEALRLDQGAFGEGFCDSLAVLMADDPVFGRDLFGPQSHARDIGASDVPYPCPGIQPHYCGQTLARAWWDIRELAGLTLQDSQAGLSLARQLFTSWAMITGGAPPSSPEGATPQSAIEVMTIADDNGELADGTPNDCILCTALAARNLPCPPPFADVDGNGLPDHCQNDCNQNGVDDLIDLADQTSQDCNGNLMPDECEADCNDNGLEDGCDIASGVLTDCNNDGAPDECAAACTDHCECNDHDACTYDRCSEGACVLLPRDYGDADHSGFLNIFDLFCVLNAFEGDFTNCTFEDVDLSPCSGDNILNIFDLFAVLDAYAGTDPCCGA